MELTFKESEKNTFKQKVLSVARSLQHLGINKNTSSVAISSLSSTQIVYIFRLLLKISVSGWLSRDHVNFIFRPILPRMATQTKHKIRQWNNKLLSSQSWKFNMFGKKGFDYCFNCETVNREEKVYSTTYSQAVTHPSTNVAQCCLTSVIRRELVFSTWYGRRQWTSGQFNLLRGLSSVQQK